MKHSPTPWKSKKPSFPLPRGDKWAQLSDANGTTFADIPAENAAYIVQCANAHEQLVEALKEAREFMVERLNCSPHYAPITRIDAALKASGALSETD